MRINFLRYLPLMALAATSLSAPKVAADAPFVTARGDKLFVGNTEFRFVSFNIPNLHLIEDNYNFQHTNPWRWPDEFEITDALESIRQIGGKVVRTYVISVKRADSDMGPIHHVSAPGEFNEDGFVALDRVLDVARKKGVRVILPLVDNWHWWGGAKEYAAFRGKPPEAFWTDPEVRNDFKRTIAFVLTRRNTVNGSLYRDDPTILGWETGNELSSPAEWTRDIAAYIKSLDSHHLVIDGNSLNGVQQHSIDDPNVDVVTSHHYPNVNESMVAAVRAACNRAKGQKPYFVGEFGFVPNAEMEQIIQTVEEAGLSGALLWSLRSHRREGGFYWHSEGAGGNLYKAYHWPGFDSGDAYDERTLLRLVRQSAFRIHGEVAPPLTAPLPPTLLPTRTASQIAWQGVAGAGSYVVERSDDPKAEHWLTVAADVHDAADPYRACFADTTYAPGHDTHFYYRVRARNSAGLSEPSNLIGPLSGATAHLIDEFREQPPVAAVLDRRSVSGSSTWLTQDARGVQEDIHRLAFDERQGDITYQLTAPVSRLTLFAFAADEHQADGAEVALLAAGNDGSFVELNCESKASSIDRGDYGYWVPITLTTDEVPSDCRSIRIRLAPPASGNSTVQLARLELECDAPLSD